VLDAKAAMWIIIAMQERTKALRLRRVELGGLTQLDVARKAGMHMLRYARIENCVYDPTPDERKAIAKALKASAAELFGEPAGVGQ
jgi:transcriptional regulator with XRE-family HTH domain